MPKEYTDMIYPHITEINDFQAELSVTSPLLAADHITQLGMSPQLFQNSKYERRKHLIGTSILVSQYAKQLNLQENDTFILEAAAMLHDVGHLPFSHAAEEFFERAGLVQEPESVRIIKESDEVQSVLQKYGVDIDKVCLSIDKPKGVEDNFFHQLISGDLDCDRLDYLRRDSRYTASYGEGIRLARILSHVELKENKVVYREGALTEIGHVFDVYRAMYGAVYHNMNTRAFETMLSRALEYKVQSNSNLRVEDIAKMSEEAIKNCIQSGGEKQGDQIAWELGKRIFDKKEPYKDILFIRSSDVENHTIIQKMFPANGEQINERVLEEAVRKECKLSKGEVFVKTEPLPSRNKNGTDVYVLKKFGALGSPIVKFEELADPGETKRKNLLPYSVRIIAPNEQKYRNLQPKIIKLLGLKTD